ncbi:site-specific integrase [Robertmurraya sp. P23]|uniref:site-specific integrase n=1 Tax=Robertmurraya sp. P23 TaxID=3436931 RepID=UPI003D95E275
MFRRYIKFMIVKGIHVGTIRRHSNNVAKVLQKAELDLLSSSEITESWLMEALRDLNVTPIKPSMVSFLNSEGILKRDKEKAIHESILKYLDKVPKEFTRLLNIYINERFELRERQIKFNARRPLSLLTVLTDMELYVRCVRWLVYERKHVGSWDTIQQEDIHAYLLILKPKHREIARKKLLLLLKLAKRKRIITHIPLLDIKSRELPSTIEILSIEEQRRVAGLIRMNRYEKPIDCLLTSLCFYHGLSNKQISNIKMDHINVDKKLILFEKRPPVYLLDDELELLNIYINYRKNLKNTFSNSSYLIKSGSNADIYEDRPVNKTFVSTKVKNLCNFTPKSLRITCFNMISSSFGPQLLVEGFGLSLTQASRYGKLEDFLIEETIQDQRSQIFNGLN